MVMLYLSALGGFQSTLPAWGSDPCRPALPLEQYRFNPRSPRGGATAWGSDGLPIQSGFNPRSPRGGATGMGGTLVDLSTCFNPRSPRGGATQINTSKPNIAKTRFNPRSPRGGATRLYDDEQRTYEVSIHAPRVGERHLGSPCGVTHG